MSQNNNNNNQKKAKMEMDQTGFLKYESFLDRSRVSQVMVPRDEVICISPDSTMKQAMNTLSEAGISGAPLYDRQENLYTGFIDVLDLALGISEAFAQNQKSHAHLYDPKEIRSWLEKPVSTLSNKSKRDPFQPIDAGQSVLFLIKNFLKFGYHRLVVSEIDKEGVKRMVGMVSQSNVVRFLYENREECFTRQICEQPLFFWGLESSALVSIPNDQPLYEAFNRILQHNISGLPVTDFHSGKIVSTISASDLKGITETTFFQLEAPIHQMLALSNKLPVVSVSPDDTLETVFGKFCDTGVHRIFVTDPQGKPTGCISLTDILRKYVDHLL